MGSTLLPETCIGSPRARQKPTCGQEHESLVRKVSMAPFFDPCFSRTAVRETCTPVSRGQLRAPVRGGSTRGVTGT
eukprot:2920804-Pleurochrysis_carterae.AAC.1